MKRRGIRIAALVACLLSSVGAAGVAGTAQAADQPECPGFGYLCVWTSTHFNGTRARFFYSNNTWSGSPVQNNDESWLNDGTQPVRVYDYWQGPQTLCMPPGWGYLAATVAANKGDANVWTASTPC
mgnify:CR=1 FL=1